MQRETTPPRPFVTPHAPGGRAAVIAGVGGCLPETRVVNADLAVRFATSDEWIRARTGIRARHVAGPGEATSDLAVQAGHAALKSANAGRVDVVILATATPDHRCPATAPAVASRLGLGHVAAFDVSAVCSGFVYGLAVADGLIGGGTADRVLLIGADVFSSILDPGDRGTGVVFGDGAGAVVLRAGDRTEPGAVRSFDLGSDGELSELITVRAGGSRLPYGHPDVTAEDGWFTMRGQAVYRHAVRRMTASGRAALDGAGWRPEDVDRLVAHQANLRILQTVGTELGVPPERVYANVGDLGNTVAASIPLALAQAAADGVLRAGDRVLLTAFGGGATWGSATLVWPPLDT